MAHYVRPRKYIETDKAALRDWVAQQNTKGPEDNPLTLTERGDVLVLEDSEVGKVARFSHHDEGWTLDWMRRNGRWERYDNKYYRTLAIPMLELDQDPDGVFWG